MGGHGEGASYAGPVHVAPPLISELLQRHKEEVAWLSSRVRSLGHVVEGEGWGSDVWMLKYVLSFVVRAWERKARDAGPAQQEARLARAVEGFGKMAAYRREHREVLEAVRANRRVDIASLVPQGDLIQRCLVAGVVEGGASMHGAPLFLLRAGLCNPRALMDRVEERNMVLWMLLQRERMLVDLEAVYGATGRLAGVLNVSDLNGVSFWSSTDSRFQRMLSHVSRLSSFYYPMLIERNVVVNPPYFFRAVFRVVRPLISARVLSKLSVCPGFNARDRITGCPYASRAFRPEALPTFLGGTNPLGVAGCSNDAREAAPERVDGDDGIEVVCVSAGRKHEVAVDVGADSWRAKVGHAVGLGRRADDDSAGEGGSSAGAESEAEPDADADPVAGDASGSHGYNLEYEVQVEAHSVEASVWFRAGFPAGGKNHGSPRSGAEQLHCSVHRSAQGWCRGTVGLPGPGVAWLVFSNASSRFTSKTVRFRHAVVPIDADGK